MWASVNSTVRLSDDWGFVADFHVRRNDFLTEPSFDFLRVGANRWLSDLADAHRRLRAHVAPARAGRLEHVVGREPHLPSSSSTWIRRDAGPSSTGCATSSAGSRR